jgi:hypothetical protein
MNAADVINLQRAVAVLALALDIMNCGKNPGAPDVFLWASGALPKGSGDPAIELARRRLLASIDLPGMEHPGFTKFTKECVQISAEAKGIFREYKERLLIKLLPQLIAEQGKTEDRDVSSREAARIARCRPETIAAACESGSLRSRSTSRKTPSGAAHRLIRTRDLRMWIEKGGMKP